MGDPLKLLTITRIVIIIISPKKEISQVMLCLIDRVEVSDSLCPSYYYY